MIQKLRSVLVKACWLVLTLAALGYYLYHKAIEAPLSLPASPVVFEVKQGEGLNSVLTRLVAQGVLPHALPAKLYSRWHTLDGKIKAGEFALQSPMNTKQLIARLTSNQQIQYFVTLVEGTRFSDARALLAAQGKLAHTLTGLSDAEVRQRLRAPLLQAYTHPEGLLFPDTYAYRKGDSDLDILQRAHQRLSDVLQQTWEQRREKLPLQSPYEALILASIIEKETGVPEERAAIAGVFTRRLQQGMRLQTDPTVIYGLGDTYKGNITRAHLRAYTPYNTYRIDGLPPTPIALAGREAIAAALNPQAGDSLYFVAKGDGSHAFSATLEEHNRAVRAYQLQRRSDYRSSRSPASSNPTSTQE